MIEFRNVGKTYQPLFGSPVRAVEDFSLTIELGEVMGIAGPNGAGKSTLISMLLGYVLPTEGTVRIDGMEPRAYIERYGVGYLSELIAINPRWTVDGALARYAILAGVPEGEIQPRVDEVVERLGLDEHRRKKVKELSKGNLQRLGLAQALLRSEAVFILDEPTHGLDPVWTTKFRDIVEQLRRPDRAILIASHNLDELERLADRVAIIDRGQLQRVVDVRGAGGELALLGAGNAAGTYRLSVAAGAEVVPEVFPGARNLGRGEFVVEASDLAALNRGVAELIVRGTLLAGFAPVQSALEQQFREAIGEVT
ncbi:MAG TPA: ABC transporter ATP-binding protein [Gemmatimonadaceae bacterium]|nr:ABC transporter ATP-binding protein [Gemmatimonadaceae bacterium]